MGSLAEELMNELNCETAFTIPVFGGIPVPESVVATWIIMAFLVVASLYLTRNLQIVPTGKRQVFVESCVTFLQDFSTGIFGEHGKRYVPYLGTVLLFIGCANLIGLFGIKPPTKDLNVTAGLAIMSIVLIEYAGIHQKGVKGWVKSFAEPMPIITPINILVSLHATFWECIGCICRYGTDQDHCTGDHSSGIQPVLRYFRWTDSGLCICISDCFVYQRSHRIKKNLGYSRRK